MGLLWDHLSPEAVTLLDPGLMEGGYPVRSPLGWALGADFCFSSPVGSSKPSECSGSPASWQLSHPMFSDFGKITPASSAL